MLALCVPLTLCVMTPSLALLGTFGMLSPWEIGLLPIVLALRRL